MSKTPWNKGKIGVSQETSRKIIASLKKRVFSKETREKLRENVLGNKNPMFGKAAWNKGNSEYISGNKNPNFGKKMSDEQKRKLSKSMMGHTHNQGIKKTDEHKRKLAEANRGKKASEETRKKMSVVRIGKQVGENNPMWKGGLTPENSRIRASREYHLWRTAVFQRDSYTCIWCGMKGDINADHIKPFAYFPELRFAIDNGRTLCVPCHKTTDTYGKKYKIN